MYLNIYNIWLHPDENYYFNFIVLQVWKVIGTQLYVQNKFIYGFVIILIKISELS